MLQSVLSGAIHVVGATGATAIAMNTAGQALIHGMAVFAGPVGWAISIARTAHTVYKIASKSQQAQLSNSTTTNICSLLIHHFQIFLSFQFSITSQLKEFHPKPLIRILIEEDRQEQFKLPLNDGSKC
jgi:hypothetical protein